MLQKPVLYTFPVKNIAGTVQINIIDTPGLIDPKGIGRDKENIKEIIVKLAEYRYVIRRKNSKS